MWSPSIKNCTKKHNRVVIFPHSTNQIFGLWHSHCCLKHPNTNLRLGYSHYNVQLCPIFLNNIIIHLLIVFMFRVMLQFIHKLRIYSERLLVFICKASILCNISIFFYQLRCQNCGEETKDWVYMCLIVS